MGLCCGGYLDRDAGGTVMTTITVERAVLEQALDALQACGLAQAQALNALAHMVVHRAC